MNRSLAFALMGGALLVQPALGDTRDDVYAAMLRCRILRDDRAWLDCAYGAQQPMRAKLGLSPAPEFQQRLVPSAGSPQVASLPAPEAEPARTQGSGRPRHSASFMQILTGSALPVTVSALASVQYDGQGAFIATLQNGQVWHQLDADGARAPLKAGTKITITPGAMGSYNLRAADVRHMYKVKLES